MIRRQLPAYSPISLPAMLRGAVAAITDPAGATEGLERMLLEALEADWVVLTSSGTDALRVAFEALDPPPTPGEPVLLPAYSCFDLVSAAVGAGVPVRFYDIDPRTLTPRTADLERAARDGCRAIVASNLFGFPLDWSSVRALADDVGATLIEDAAQALGSTWHDRSGGTFGDLTVLSFGRGKGWTGGSGGALVGRGRRLDQVTAGLREGRLGARDFLVSLAVWILGRPSLYRVPASVPALGLGETRYKTPTAPSAINRLAAAVAFRHADMARDAVEGRRARAAALGDALEGVSSVELCRPLEAGRCGYLRYPVLAPDRGEAERYATALQGSGVARGYPVALPDLPQVQALAAESVEYPGAVVLAERLLTLPTHPRVGHIDVRRIEAVLRGAAVT